MLEAQGTLPQRQLERAIDEVLDAQAAVTHAADLAAAKIHALRDAKARLAQAREELEAAVHEAEVAA